MRKLSAIVLSLVAGCSIGDDPKTGDEHVDAAPVPVTGKITANTTWKGTMQLTGITEIAPMVTVSVEAGTTLEFAQGAGIRVNGGLILYGTSAAKIIGKAQAGATVWGPIDVDNGYVHMEYASFTGGSITTNGALAKLEIIDSKMFKASGDYIVMNGGSINMQYSQLGPDQGETDTTHCNLHINSSTTVSILRNNIAGAPYGVMFYGGIGSNFQLNNWYGNMNDVDTQSGVEGNFSYSWFERGAPTAGPGAMIVADELATAKITQAGPRL